MREIKIKRFVDFPFPDGAEDIEIEGYIYTDTNKGFFVIKDKEMVSKFDNVSKKNIETLFLIDENNNKITIKTAKTAQFLKMPLSDKITILRKEIILGSHLSYDQKIKSLQFKIKESVDDFTFLSQIGDIEFCFENIKVSSKRDNGFIILIEGESSLKELKEIFRSLCELIFLFYGIYPEYDKAKIVLQNDNICELFTSGHKFKYEKRKKYLIDNLECGKINYEKSFENYIEFREDSGLIFDIFLNTVYSESFEEDYPLRFSQCIEGVMDYKKLSKKDEHGKGPYFVDIIRQSINYDKSLKKLFDFDDSKIEEFAEKTKNHRHLFSHAKHKSERFEGIENKYAAIKLYTILRFIIIKECVDESYFNSVY